MTNGSDNNGVWMRLESGASNIERNKELASLPWVLDEEQIKNWSDDETYHLEVRFREWLRKAVTRPNWKVAVGAWGKSRNQTLRTIQLSMGLPTKWDSHAMKLNNIVKYYCVKIVKHKIFTEHNYKQGKEVRRSGKLGGTGYRLPYDFPEEKPAFSLRLRIEIAASENRVLRQKDLKAYTIPTIAEMKRTQALIAQKRRERLKRYRDKHPNQKQAEPYYFKIRDISNNETSSGS